MIQHKPLHRSQHFYKLYICRTEKVEQVDSQLGQGALADARVLLLDWRHVLNRSCQGTSYQLGKVSTDNLRFLRQNIQVATGNHQIFFTCVLFYIDADGRAEEVLGYINNAAGLSALVNFVLIARKDRCGAEGK